MAQTSNLGAVVFWLYIVAALTFTFLVINSIIKTPAPKQSKHVATFTILAILSFSTLSFNMLHVLFNSYTTWLEKLVPAPLLSPSSIWDWSISSRQFRDFGEAIVKNEARYLWTQSSLMTTLSVSYFMAFEGTRNKVPRLWAYFALAQILPISFAQNLFFIALMRSHGPRKAKVNACGGHAIPHILLYCMFLAMAPFAARRSGLMTIIGVARVFLAMPLMFTNLPDGIEKDPFFNWTGLWSHGHVQTVVCACAWIMTMKEYFGARTNGVSDANVYQALFSHPAVTTLGVDFLMTMASFVVWLILARRKEQAKVEAKKFS